MPDYNPSCCGAGCATCSAGTNEVAECDAGTCTTACAAGTTRCSAVCRTVLERTWRFDRDGDGRSQADAGVELSCTVPDAGFVQVFDDCNDSDILAYPGANERCNGRDDDCDDILDEGTLCGRGQVCLGDAGCMGSGGPPDAGTSDAGGAGNDGGGGATDAGTALTDAGALDAGAVDSGAQDAGQALGDAGEHAHDAGSIDSDAGQVAFDAGAGVGGSGGSGGETEGGPTPPTPPQGCGCGAVDSTLAIAGLIAAWRRRRAWPSLRTSR